MPGPRFTDRQLRAVLHRIAQTYLEVERGLRPPDHLAAFLTEAEYRRHRGQPRPQFPSTGPVVPRDLGRIHLDRTGQGQVTASVLARQDGQRWGALLIHLRETNSGWKVDQLERLERAPRRQLSDSTQVAEPDDLDRRIRCVQDERREVAAAQRASAAWLDDLRNARHGNDSPPNIRRVRQQVGMWARRLADLDHELDTLRRTRQLRQRLASLDGDQDPGGSPAASVTDPILQVLGPKPNDPRWSKIWDQTAHELRHYRQRWDITDSDPPLGAPTDEPEQARHRELLVQLLRTVVPWLEHRRRSEREVTLSPQAARHVGASRDLGVEP